MKQELLGAFSLPYKSFENLDASFKEFHTPSFHSLSLRKKFKKVNQTLLEHIQGTDAPCFLLPTVLEFIDRVNKEKILHELYRFTSFEFWLNRFSRLDEEENLKIRGKIVGKWIPRGDYQALFPIGMGKTFSGSHFVAAHSSPDIDTTIASFSGWLDAFGARVSEGIHQWSLPALLPDSHFTYLFQELFSPYVFKELARHTPALTLTALDLVTQRDVLKVHAHTLASHLDHNSTAKAIILIDENDLYKGDWRSIDAESVRQITMLFTNIIRWFENSIHAKLIATFAKKTIHLCDIANGLDPIFETEIKHAEPFKDYTERQKKHLDDYLKKIISLEKGIHATILELGDALDTAIGSKFQIFYGALKSLSDPELYDKNDRLIEDRPKIFSRLEKIIADLYEVIQHVRSYVERLSVMLQVKELVLNHPIEFITLKSDVDEIRSKMNDLDHLTVVIPEGTGKWYPVGVVHANDLRRPVLGTCSLRDFSNEQETQMASYLEVISVIDHHKTTLKTSSAPCFVIADVQSANTLVAELAFEINDRYSSLGITLETVNAEIARVSEKTIDIEKIKHLSRLLTIKANLERKDGFFVDPRREFSEYRCYLYAILDDTDLLTKISDRDAYCVATLLNRMKSLSCGQETEIISLDHIPKDESFAKKAAAYILQNKDMYSIYKKIYEFKEQEMEDNLKACIAGKPSTVFADTKEQNGCCRVGQTKIFSTNYPFFHEHANTLRTLWFEASKKVYEAKSQINFHLHMVSTIAGAEEVYTGHIGNWKHQDEMWFWVPPTEQGVERLADFLIAFHPTPVVQNNSMEVEFLGDNATELRQIFTQNFPKAVEREESEKKVKENLPIAVLRFKAGTINSRKALITPYLPRFVP